MMPSRPASLYLSLLFIIQIATRCNTQGLSPLHGKIDMAPGWKPVVYLIQPRNFSEIASNFGGIVLDSAAIAADGQFAFHALPGGIKEGLFELCIQKIGTRYANQLADEDPGLSNYMPVYLKNGLKTQIRANCANFQASFTLPESDAVNKTLLQVRDIRQQAWLAQKSLLSKENPVDEHNLMLREDALLQFRKPLMAYADTCAQLWPALLAARWVSPESDYERVPEFLVGLCRKWREKLPDNPWVAQLCQSGNSEKLPLLTGDTMPNFPLPTVDSDTVMLHSLLGERLTIVDIWASWCAPCRRENREALVPLWAQFQAKGLQIIAYSIDSSPEAWRAAIVKDKASWTHVSHLSGDSTPFMDKLRINTIPANFLLDAKGKVVAKNLHGEALKGFVEGYLR